MCSIVHFGGYGVGEVSWNKDIAYIPFKNVVSLAKALDMSVDELAELLLLDY